MTSFDRACSGSFDSEYERELANAIMAAIATTSAVSDCDARVIRTGEATSALVRCLALMLALSPASSRTRQARQQLMKELSRRLQKRIDEAHADPVVRDFMNCCFRDDDRERGGCA